MTKAMFVRLDSPIDKLLWSLTGLGLSVSQRNGEIIATTTDGKERAWKWRDTWGQYAAHGIIKSAEHWVYNG